MALIIVGAVLLGIGLLTQLISGVNVFFFFFRPIFSSFDYIVRMIEHGRIERLAEEYFRGIAAGFPSVIPHAVFFCLGAVAAVAGLALLIAGVVMKIKKKKAAAAAAVAKPETEATN